jgi:hypothetical protein
MRKLNQHLAVLLLFSLGTLISVFAETLSGGEERTAIVCFVEGKAWVSDPGAKEQKEIELFDWLKIGETVETGAEARLVVAFSTGDRQEVGEKTKAAVGPAGFTSVSGSVKKLSPTPVMPKIVSLSQESKPGSRMSGIRLRGGKQEISDLYPGNGASIFADEAVLTFSHLGKAERFRVELEDELGNNILSIETTSPQVAVSPGILKSGANYYWSVRTLEKDKPSAVVDAEFSTITEEEARTLRAFRSQAFQSEDATELLLLAEIDLTLGLRKEACEALQAALSLSPDNEKIKKAAYLQGCK